MGRLPLQFSKSYAVCRVEDQAIQILKEKYPGKSIQLILVERAYADIGYIPKNV